MLLDPGLLTPFDVAAWTPPPDAPGFTPLAAILAANLTALADAHTGTLATMASDGDPTVDTSAAGDLNDADTNQAANVDSLDTLTPGDISAHADAQTGDVSDLASETAGDIAAGNVNAPGFVSHPIDGAPPPPGETPPPKGTQPPPSGGYATAFVHWLTATFEAYLGRDPGDEDLAIWSATWPNTTAMLAGIVASDEYAAAVNALYQSYFGRDVQAQELADARAQQWTLAQVTADLQRRS